MRKSTAPGAVVEPCPASVDCDRAPGIPTHSEIRAPSNAVRDGGLSPEQRDHLVTLLHLIDTAAALAAGTGERYPDNTEQAAAYAAAAWEPVDTGYAKLLDAVSSSVAAQ